MEKIENFFDEMKKLFLVKDMDEFEEIKEDMLEHIEIKLEQGEPVEVILTKLGTPKAIVDAFYEDKRLNKAMQYETDIIGIEEVQIVALQGKKDKLYKQVSRLKRGGVVTLKVVFVLLIVFSFVYFIWNLIKYGHFSFLIALIFGNSLFGLGLLRDINHKSTKRMSFFTLIFVIISFFIMYSIHYKLFFYKGEVVDESIQLNQNSFESLTLTGDFPINLTIEQTSSTYPSIKLKGKMTKGSKEALKELIDNKEMVIDLGQKTPMSLFTAMGELDVSLSIPKSTEKNLVLDFENADIQARDILVRHFDIAVETGNIVLEDIDSQHLRVVSEKADLLVNSFDTPIEVNNEKGKSIIKNGVGNMTVKTQTGFTNLLNINGDKANVVNNRGKLIMTDTSLDEVNITSDKNTLVIENQIGHTTLNIKNGNIILRENQGTLDVVNGQGSVIITQHKPIKGSIKSESGLVKWFQYVDEDNEAPDFLVKSGNKNVRNDFKNSTDIDKGKVFEIETVTSEIDIIKK